MKESDIERHLAERIRKAGGLCLKIVSPGCVGIPDRLVILPGGETTWCELKTPKGKVSAVQLRMHTRLKELTQEVEILRSVEAINKRFPLE